MKVTFLTPPTLVGKRPAERTAGCTHVVYLAPNIYELTVAAVVEQSGRHTAAVADFVYHRQKPNHFDRFLTTDDSDVYAIWMVNLSVENDLAACERIHAMRPAARVMLMGPGATHYAERCLTDARVIVVRGEPELTALALLDALAGNSPLAGVEGLSWRDGDNIRHNPSRALISNLDTLPFPARHFISDRSYYNPKLNARRYTTAVTSRNCPYGCIYCVPSSLTFAREIEHRRLHGRKPPVALRSVENVEQELTLIRQMGYDGVGFMDDNFIWNETRTLALCDILRRLGLVWGCQARVDAITEPIARALGRSGCQYVDLGVESFNDEILRYIGKGITSDQITRAINLLKQYHVPVKLNILIGCSPLETPQTVADTLRRAKQADVDQVMFNIVSPFPGTEYYEICRKNGWLATPTGEYQPSDVQRQSILNLPHLSARQMEQALRRNNFSYFLSWAFVKRHAGRFSTPAQWGHALRALRVKLFG